MTIKVITKEMNVNKHEDANKNKGNSAFITVLLLTVFNNEHNSYLKMSGERPLACN